MKAAFDNVEREKLWQILEGKGIKKRIIERLRRICEEIWFMVRTEAGLIKEFITKK